MIDILSFYTILYYGYILYINNLNSFHRKGLAIEEVANLLLDHGVVFAINMDGGGSSTMVMPKNNSIKPPNNNNNNSQINYTVVNQPTCLDIPLPYHCQRSVATVLCVSS